MFGSFDSWLIEFDDVFTNIYRVVFRIFKLGLVMVTSIGMYNSTGCTMKSFVTVGRTCRWLFNNQLI